MFPAALELFRGVRSDLPEREFAAQLLACDRFRRCRTFRYLGGKFIQSEVTSAKPVERFFGYLGMRTAFQDHFRKFAAGKTNLPLLVNSLPGYGKTSLTVSFALAEPELVLILPDPEARKKGGSSWSRRWRRGRTTNSCCFSTISTRATPTGTASAPMSAGRSRCRRM